MNTSCLILMAHGSRDPQWSKPFESLLQKLRVDFGHDHVHLAYMENAHPMLPEVMQEATAKGFKNFQILPLFMSSGVHMSQDIPAQTALVDRAISGCLNSSVTADRHPSGFFRHARALCQKLHVRIPNPTMIPPRTSHESGRTLAIGNRCSPIEVRHALRKLRRFLPEIIPGKQPSTDPCSQVLAGEACAGIDRLAHLPNPIPSGLDWVWLAAAKDPAETWVLFFRAEDPYWLRVRSLLVKQVVFAGAGPGAAELCTLGAIHALQRCDICLHDNGIDPALFHHLPPGAEPVNVGKRCGFHAASQGQINEMLAAATRQGKRVVRLKSGDPGIFGRLAEEIDTLDALQLPFRVIPGVSSLNAATTGTGILLTQRGASRGFSVMTPRVHDGGLASIGSETRSRLPMVIFMGILVIQEIVDQLLREHLAPENPVAVVFDSGTPRETVVRGCLNDIAAKIEPHRMHHRGLVIVGSPNVNGYHRRSGALMGQKILLPAGLRRMSDKIGAIHDFGGIPLRQSSAFRRLPPDPASPESLPEFDAVVIDSIAMAEELTVKIPIDMLVQKTLVTNDHSVIDTIARKGIPTKNILISGKLPEIEALAAARVRAELNRLNAAAQPRKGRV